MRVGLQFQYYVMPSGQSSAIQPVTFQCSSSLLLVRNFWGFAIFFWRFLPVFHSYTSGRSIYGISKQLENKFLPQGHPNVEDCWWNLICAIGLFEVALVQNFSNMKGKNYLIVYRPGKRKLRREPLNYGRQSALNNRPCWPGRFYIQGCIIFR